MKILLRTIDPKHKEYIVNVPDMANQSPTQRFQDFTDHFKLSGRYLIYGGTKAILYHTVLTMEIVPDEPQAG